LPPLLARTEAGTAEDIDMQKSEMTKAAARARTLNALRRKHEVCRPAPAVTSLDSPGPIAVEGATCNLQPAELRLPVPHAYSA
jgi:hypothetical protein